MSELNSIQLHKILTTDKFTKQCFRGVFARNMLPKKALYPSCLIVNTDPSNKPGGHWLAIYYNHNGESEFFDSYGLHPFFYGLDTYLEKTSSKWTQNKKQIQSFYSNLCGYYCFFYLIAKCRGYSLDEMNFNEKELNLFLKKYF